MPGWQIHSSVILWECKCLSWPVEGHLVRNCSQTGNREAFMTLKQFLGMFAFFAAVFQHTATAQPSRFRVGWLSTSHRPSPISQLPKMQKPGIVSEVCEDWTFNFRNSQLQTSIAIWTAGGGEFSRSLCTVSMEISLVKISKWAFKI